MRSAMIKKLAAFAAAAILFTGGGTNTMSGRIYAEASPVVYSAIYSNAARELSLYAETGKPSAHVTVSVSAYEKGTSFSDENIPLFLYVYDTDEKGILSETIRLSSSYASGKYYVCADYGTRALQTIIILNENDAKTIDAVSQVNQCETADEMRDVLKKAENRYVFGVDLSLLTDIPKSMAEYCLAAREEEEGKAFTPGRFSALLAKAVVIVQIQESDNTEQIVKENAALFGTSAETIDTLPDTQKHILLKLLKNADYTKTAPEDVFAEKLLTSRAAAAESMSEMRYIIESHAAAFGTDVSQGSDYMTIREDKRISVFGYMLSDSENFTSYADVKNAFDAAVQKVKKESVKNSGSSGNSGSGSSSGGRKTNVVLPRQTDTSTEKDNQTEVFSDIQESYAKEYIRQLCDQKVLNGFPDGTFRPNESVTRAEFAKMLCILLNLSGGNAAFSDVNTSDWFYSYVAACAQKGIVNGFEGKFMPQNTITREDCAVMVCRALELAEAGTVTNFLDDEAISDYAKGAVSALSDKKILIGDNGFFRAKDNLKRGDAAIILCKLTEALS